MKVYYEKVFWDIYYKYNIFNFMKVPYIHKIVLNASFGRFFFNKKMVNIFYNDLFNICDQKPFFIKSKKSLSEFKIKKNDIISIKLTLRKNNMYNFLYKFLTISVPNIKNFEGFNKKSFDNFGNYSLGINDYSIFPDNINSGNFDFSVGFNIVISFKLSDPIKSLSLLKFFNFPFKNV